MSLKIVDVSSYQGKYAVGINGESGVIIKATEGTGYVNPCCDYVAQQAVKKRIPWGLYHYAKGENPAKEADYFLKNISGYLKQSNKPVLILDWELGGNLSWGKGDWVKQWMDEVKRKAGVQPGLYTGSDGVYQTSPYVSGSAWLWCAAYPTAGYTGWSPTNIGLHIGKWKLATGWQFTDAPVDKSLFYIDTKGWGKLANSKVTPVKASHPNTNAAGYTNKGYIDTLGVHWIKQSGTYTCNTATNLRCGATASSSLIATVSAGSKVKYDHYALSGGYVWIRQPRGGNAYGYMATGDESGGKRTSSWGKFN